MTLQMCAQRRPLSFPAYPDAAWHACGWEVQLQMYSAPLPHARPEQSPRSVCATVDLAGLLQSPFHRTPQVHWCTSASSMGQPCHLGLPQAGGCLCHYQVLLLTRCSCNEHQDQRGKAVLQSQLRIEIYEEGAVTQPRSYLTKSLLPHEELCLE